MKFIRTLFCPATRRQLKRHWDDGKPLSNRAKTHLESCHECRRFYLSHSAVINALKSTTPSDPTTSMPFLHRKIMASIQNTDQEVPVRSPLLNWRYGFITACLCVALSWIFLKSLPNHQNQVVVDTESHVPSAYMATLLEPLEGQTLLQFASSASAPLELEMKRMVQDARNAANAIADRFLPKSGELKER